MNYIENVFICLAAPILTAIVCLRGVRRRTMVFLFIGMTACLLSSYVSTFLNTMLGSDPLTTSLEISPSVEEIIKLLPVLFYLAVLDAKKEDAAGCVLIVAVGFATFENVCYLTQNGAMNVPRLLIRGFGTGAMHVICGVIVSIGLFYLWDLLWLRIAGAVSVLALAIAFHGIFNLLVSQEGIPMVIGYLIPMITAGVRVVLGKKLWSGEFS